MTFSVQDRRTFIACAGSAAVAVGMPSTGRCGPVARAPLASRPEEVEQDYDVVIVGSGYGGAVMAARLAQGRRLCVLERGAEWHPDDFPADAASALALLRSDSCPLGLFDYRLGATMDVMSGSGLGGTSLINANVVIGADRDAFGRWPRAIQDDVARGVFGLHEQRVREMLAVDTVVEDDALRKHWFHRSTTASRGRQGIAAKAVPVPIAVNLRRYSSRPNAHGIVQPLCTHCGDCVSGCRSGAKNSLDVNYLPLARARGARLFACIEVDWLERLHDGRWRVHYIARPSGRPPVRGQTHARDIVLAAGSLGSTEILLRSRVHGLPLPAALGTRFSSNGDLLGFAYNTDIQLNSVGFGRGVPPAGQRRTGPTITMAADYRAGRPLEQRFLIEEGSWPSALVPALRLGLAAAAGMFPDLPSGRRVARDLIGLHADGALNHSQVYLGIGHDSASGRIVLDGRGRAQVVWPGAADEPFVKRIQAEMRAHAETFAGRYLDSPRNGPVFGGAMTTVHPLGGCPMGETSSDAVVDADCRVFDPDGGPRAVHRGLRVVDGSVAPGSIGVNPLLTIAAVAERAAARFNERVSS